MAHLANATPAQLRLDATLKQQLRATPDHVEIWVNWEGVKSQEVVAGYRRHLRHHYEIGYITFGPNSMLVICRRRIHRLLHIDTCLDEISVWSDNDDI